MHLSLTSTIVDFIERARDDAVCDDDGNGSISVDELRDVMNGLVDRLTYYEVEGMVQQADKEGKGEISFHGNHTATSVPNERQGPIIVIFCTGEKQLKATFHRNNLIYVSDLVPFFRFYQVDNGNKEIAHSGSGVDILSGSSYGQDMHTYFVFVKKSDYKLGVGKVS